MNRKLNKLFLLLVLALPLFFAGLSSCKKDENKNPYDQYNNGNVDSTNILLPPTSIQGLHQQIFKPTCANSGCHDGTFEPDYRTIESTYNTLVYHSIIKNDNSDPLEYRVKPFDVEHSMLVRRMTVDLNGNSGTMPLDYSIDSTSDWNEKKNEHIENIKTWIRDGAKDISGNVANPTNRVPQINGMIITPQGSSTPFPRNISGVVQIPSGVSAIDIYLSFSDAETAAGQLNILTAQFSLSRDDYSVADTLQATTTSPIMAAGYGGSQVSYAHKISVPSVSAYWQGGTSHFFSAKVSDGTNTVSLPGLYALDIFKTYYSFKLL